MDSSINNFSADSCVMKGIAGHGNIGTFNGQQGKHHKRSTKVVERKSDTLENVSPSGDTRKFVNNGSQNAPRIDASAVKKWTGGRSIQINNKLLVKRSVSVDPLKVKQLNESCCKEIINLEDDEISMFKEKVITNKTELKDTQLLKSCCNYQCGTHDNLINASSYVLTYYGIPLSKAKIQKVCERCFDEAFAHQEHLSYMLYHNKPINNVPFPQRSEMVMLSDEEGSEEDLEEPIDVDIEVDVGEVIHSTFKRFKLNKQVDKCVSSLEDILSYNEIQYHNVNETLDLLQKNVDKARGWFYEGFTPQIKELPPVILTDNSFLSPSKNNQTAKQSQYYGQTNENKRSPIAGVATKKVTQVHRTYHPGSQAENAVDGKPQLNSNVQNTQQEVVALEQVERVRPPVLPPLGQLVRSPIQIGDTLYVMKHGYYGMWSRAKVIEISRKGPDAPFIKESTYRVRFETRKAYHVKCVTGKQVAYPTPSPVRLPVGTRVIALFRDEWAKECYYAGIVAEPPKPVNKYRYLVFFDDGYAQYVVHEKILLVCECSRNVWEDIHPDSRDFVKNYLEQYPERPMLKLQQGQIVKTEWNGKWWIARAIEIDGSLVKMHFDADGRTELIYRGSTRLGPLFTELEQAQSRKIHGSFSRHRSLGISSLKRRNMPYVEYTRTDQDENRHEESPVTITLLGSPYKVNSSLSLGKQFPSRAVAKKSTSRRSESAHERLEALILSSDRDIRAGRVETLDIVPKYRPKQFDPHQCGFICVEGLTYDHSLIRKFNTLVIPQLYGWQRHITRFRGKRAVLYRSPCGRRLRNMEELHRYLRVTKSMLSVDQFDFDFWVHCFSEYIISRGFVNIKDLSYGCENVPVPCVNNLDHSEPEFVKYSTVRLPMQGVNLNTDLDFLVCCDCTDDCQDKSKCACWQLTIQGTAYGPGGFVDPTVGYSFKRLLEPVMTGIYECNSRCKCASTCLNRVAQHPLQLRLQVFKTENRGWGIRCLNDVPQGAFICIYAGRLLTEQGANECVYVEGGKNYGDEYLAELDYIEVVERLKEGYESDVMEDEDMAMGGNKQDKTSKDSNQGDSCMSDDEDDEDDDEDEEDGEVCQDAEDADYEVDVRHHHLSLVPAEESTIRTRLRNRKARNSSVDSSGKDKDSSEDSDRPHFEKDLKKFDVEKKTSSGVASDDTCSLVTLSDDDDEIQREPSKFAVIEGPKKENENKPKFKSVRAHFGDDEFCYIMDAKTDGNIGRYLNHSCSPNVFVQNVFVDTHDLRFPWVAFFALTYISAGTELTWDYNYDVGSVPGKVLHCYCGSSECRGRLL